MNIRATLLSLTLLLPLSLASTAGAVEFSVIGPTSVTIAPGGTFTIDIALENANVDTVQGMTATLTGLAAAGASATSGVSASAHVVGFCSAAACFGGIDTVDNPFYNPADLSMSGAYTPGDDLIVVINALALSSSTATGSIDPGLDGGLDVPSARDVSIVLTAATAGVHVLTIGGEYSDGVNVIPIADTATFTVTVPEPTAIATSLAALGTVFAVTGIRRRA